jgi:fructose-1,6-bisphosphatase/inositol monophosphatase family enzyme
MPFPLSQAMGPIKDILSRPQWKQTPKELVKSDGSPVTDIDLWASDELTTLFSPYAPVMSEERPESHEQLHYPLFVVDPIDGTREFIRRIPECCISLAYLHEARWDADHNWGLCANPLTGEIFAKGHSHPQVPRQGKKLRAYVGHSEWRELLSRHPWEALQSSEFEILPLGSIAWKICHVAMDQADLTLTIRKKSLWDIAAGTVLCAQGQGRFYVRGQLCTSARSVEESAPMAWLARPREEFPEAWQIYERIIQWFLK